MKFKNSGSLCLFRRYNHFVSKHILNYMTYNLYRFYIIWALSLKKVLFVSKLYLIPLFCTCILKRRKLEYNILLSLYPLKGSRLYRFFAKRLDLVIRNITISLDQILKT